MSVNVVSVIFNTLSNLGVKNIVCSPGSRNAALLVEVDSNPSFKKTVIVDERTAGFVALGMAQYSRTPTVLICTSGSAVLNYAPALAEAFYQGIPLLIISADRPQEWIDQDDSQTIRQYGILKNVVKADYDINAMLDTDDNVWFVNRITNEAYINAMTDRMGPVHINIHLGQFSGHMSDPQLNGSKFFGRTIDFIKPENKIPDKVLKEILNRCIRKKILLVCGFSLPDKDLQKAVMDLSRLENVAVMAETLSNLHLPSEFYMIDSVICSLKPDRLNILKPDVVISIGGALISRKLKEFLREFSPEIHIAIGYSENLVDCFQSLTINVQIKAASFIKGFAIKANKIIRKDKPNLPAYSSLWNDERRKALKRNEEILSKTGWCDLKAFEILLDKIPSKTNLYLSNGTPVRYAQILTKTLPHATYGNRGVSGIEGCGSTALGGDSLYPGISLLVTGDMSLSYDLSVITSNMAKPSFRIIVISNGGGDIFRFIPATSNLENREQYFCINPFLPLAKLCEAYGWTYKEADDEKQLKRELETFFKPSPLPILLNIKTYNENKNSEILKSFLYNYGSELDRD